MQKEIVILKARVVWLVEPLLVFLPLGLCIPLPFIEPNSLLAQDLLVPSLCTYWAPER